MADAPSDFWRKGIVYTLRSGSPPGPGFRVSASFTRGISPAAEAPPPFIGFGPMYERARSAALERLAAAAPGASYLIECHGWRVLEEAGSMATAFITLKPWETGGAGESVPGDEELRGPGGATLEALARIKPQLSGELYREFDFTGPGAATEAITVSYGERARQGGEEVDFSPFVARAERFAEAYHARLARFDEVSGPFRAVHREWFLADPGFVTVHIRFALKA